MENQPEPDADSVGKEARACAVARINNGDSVTYLVEIARNGGLSISTLLLKPLGDEETLKSVLSVMLSLLHSYGYDWNASALRKRKDLQVGLMHHVAGQSAEEWAERMVEKCLIYCIDIK